MADVPGRVLPSTDGAGSLVPRGGLKERVAIVDRDRDARLEALNTELESLGEAVSRSLLPPARTMKDYAQILAREYAEVLDSEGRRLLSIVGDEASRMEALMDDLLVFSALARKPIEKQLVDMTAMAREVVAAHLRATTTGTDVHVGSLPAVRGDRALLQQVWTNLISNALKFSAVRNPAIVRITGSIERSQAVFRVEDNGVGFDMQHYKKLFGIFERLHPSSEFPGTGIGLAIVQRIVARHEGRVWADSAPDEGAIFSFALPAEE